MKVVLECFFNNTVLLSNQFSQEKFRFLRRFLQMCFEFPNQRSQLTAVAKTERDLRCESTQEYPTLLLSPKLHQSERIITRRMEPYL
jgi:hypothetical protein